MKQLTLLSKKAISLVVSFSLVLSFIPTLGLSNVAEATESLGDDNSKTVEEIQEKANGRIVPAEEASKEALSGGIFHVFNNYRDKIYTEKFTNYYNQILNYPEKTIIEERLVNLIQKAMKELCIF